MKLAIIGVPRSGYTLSKAIQEAIKVDLEVVIVVPPETKDNSLPKFDHNVTIKQVNWKEEDIISALKNMEVVIVISLTEFNLILAAKVREALFLPGESLETEKRIINKYTTRKSLADKNLTNIAFHRVSCIDELWDYYHFGHPFIIKPVDLTGSIGVNYVSNRDQFSKIIKDYKQNKYTKDCELLIEEYIEGEEISVEGIVVNGEFYMFAITDKRTTGIPHFLETGHTIPSKYTSIRNQINEFTSNIVEALNIKCSPIHAELKITETGYELIEIHTRYGGDMITRLIHESYGNEVFSTFYLGCLYNKKPQTNSNHLKVANIEYIVTRPGIIKQINNRLHEDLVGETVEFTLENNIGDVIESDVTPLTRIGHIIFLKQTNEESLESIKKFHQSIDLIVE